MTEQLLRDPNTTPAADIIADALGPVAPVYDQFIAGMAAHGITLMDWRFYNDGKSWLSKGEYHYTTSRGTPKVTPIFWLSIWDGFFKVSFSFAESAAAGLQKLPISTAGKKMIKNAPTNGKVSRFISVIFDVRDAAQLADIYEIANFRKSGVS